jgi:hypothetical protein
VITLTTAQTSHGPTEDTSDTTAAKVPEDENPIYRTWNHRLPFMAQKAIDRGFDLPNPYGFSGVYSHTKQDVTLSNLNIAFSSDPDAPKTPVPFVTIEQSKTDARAWEAKPDVRILPFLNACLIGGRVDGSAVVPIIVPGEATLKALLPTLGALCDKPPGFPGRPDGCDKDIIIVDHSNFTGTNYGFGITLAAGWKNFFATIPVSNRSLFSAA